MSLRPANIVQAAEADLKRRAKNVERYARGDNSIEQYAFLAMHVRNARDAAHLLKLAARYVLHTEVDDTRTIKRNTKLIYGNRDLLVKAWEIASGGDSEQGRAA